MNSVLKKVSMLESSEWAMCVTWQFYICTGLYLYIWIACGDHLKTQDVVWCWNKNEIWKKLCHRLATRKKISIWSFRDVPKTLLNHLKILWTIKIQLKNSPHRTSFKRVMPYSTHNSVEQFLVTTKRCKTELLRM